MSQIDELFDVEGLLQGALDRDARTPRPVEDMVKSAGLGGDGVDAVLGFERLWAHFLDDLRPVVAPGAEAVASGDWSNLGKEDLIAMLGVWKVWTHYRDDVRAAARRLNPFAKGGRGVDPRVSRAAQAQLRGFQSFESAIAVTEEREKQGAFARFQDWLEDKTTDLREAVRDFDLDEWAETGWGQVATGLAGAGLVAAVDYRGDVQGYQEERELPERERFDEWEDVMACYPGAVRLERVADKAVTKLGYGTVVGHVPDGRVVLQTTVSLWVVDPGDL